MIFEKLGFLNSSYFRRGTIVFAKLGLHEIQHEGQDFKYLFEFQLAYFLSYASSSIFLRNLVIDSTGATKVQPWIFCCDMAHVKTNI